LAMGVSGKRQRRIGTWREGKKRSKRKTNVFGNEEKAQNCRARVEGREMRRGRNVVPRSRKGQKCQVSARNLSGKKG